MGPPVKQSDINTFLRLEQVNGCAVHGFCFKTSKIRSLGEHRSLRFIRWVFLKQKCPNYCSRRKEESRRLRRDSDALAHRPLMPSCLFLALSLGRGHTLQTENTRTSRRLAVDQKKNARNYRFAPWLYLSTIGFYLSPQFIYQLPNNQYTCTTLCYRTHIRREEQAL